MGGASVGSLKLTCVFRQDQLARMTSDLCEEGGDEQREKETPAASKASSVSPLSEEVPGVWTVPLSPVPHPQTLVHPVDRL